MTQHSLKSRHTKESAAYAKTDNEIAYYESCYASSTSCAAFSLLHGSSAEIELQGLNKILKHEEIFHI